MNKAKKVLEWIVDIFIIIIFIIAVVVMIASISKAATGVSSIFGIVINTVQSDSMAGDKADNFNKGDIVFGKAFKEGDVFEVGQIISFKQIVNGYEIINTHRIIDKGVDPSGKTYYTTKGDNELGTDPGYVTEDRIVALYTGKLPGVGKFIDWLREPAGFIICIVLPITATIVYQVYKIVVILLKERDKRIAVSAAEQAPDEVRQAIIDQFLQEQAALAKQTPPADTPQGETPVAPTDGDVPTDTTQG